MMKILPTHIIKLAMTLTIMVVAYSSALGCSITILPERPRSIVNSQMFILVGEVIGNTEPISDPGNFRGTAVGVRLKIIESIHFPHYQNDYVDVFILSHGSDCFPEAGGNNMTALGTRYRLALNPARHMASQSGGRIRLESGVFGRISLDESMFGFSTTAKSEFDYEKDLRPLAQKFMTQEMADKRRWLDDFLYIEASKDLLRLSRATSKDERMKLLERLLYCPNINYRRLVFSKVGDPLTFEEGDISGLLLSTSTKPKKFKPRKLSNRENELLIERNRLETSGKLNLWR